MTSSRGSWQVRHSDHILQSGIEGICCCSEKVVQQLRPSLCAVGGLWVVWVAVEPHGSILRAVG